MSDWIWLPQSGFERDSYGIFRRTLTVKAKKPVLRIAASSNFSVTLNHVPIFGGQYSDLPGHPTYTTLDISHAWHDGENHLEIEVYVLGRRSLTTAIVPPGLWVELRDGAKVLDATDASWECAPHPAYKSNLCIPLTGQLGDTFEYDANKTAVRAWKKARVVDFPPPVARPAAVPPLGERPLPVAHVVQAGQIYRPADAEGTPAELISTDFLQSRVVGQLNVAKGAEDCQTWRYGEPMPFLLDPQYVDKLPFTWPKLSGCANGWYCIVDLGTEYTGVLTLCIQADKGAVLDIAHGEHLTDGRVRAAIGGRNYADRIIANGTTLVFHHRLRRLGARYLELHVTNAKHPPRLGYLGLAPLFRELPDPTEVTSPDRLLNAIDEAAIHTLRCCQHEHFEDCPMREQGLYPYDSRNQALYGYPIWGNYDFVAACFKLLGDNWNEGAGTLQMTSPGCIHLSIPIFGLVWVTECWELLLHSGNPKLVEPMLPVMDKLLKTVLSKSVKSPAGLLYHSGKDETIWNFCEWQPGLDRVNSPIQAPYNLYLIETLRSAAKIARVLGKCPGLRTPDALEGEADRLAKVCDKLFWDDKLGVYRTDDGGKTPIHEHTQMLALYNGVATGTHKKRLLTSLDKVEMLESTFSTLPYWVMTMRMLPAKFTARILPRLRRLYESSVLEGSKTLWETELGGEDFSFAGSLCHGWSSIPSWYLRTGLLGIEPTSPGYKTFRFRPDFADDLEYLKGSVFTPYGLITAEWRKDGKGNYQAAILSCPKECKLEK